MITEKDLEEKYYYKDDLIILCKEMNIPHFGTKLELHERLLSFIKTGTVELSNHKTNVLKKESKSHSIITLENKFIEDGLKFNQNLRNFFAKQTGKNKITFTKHMAHAVREAKRNNTDITVKDLLEIFEAPRKFLDRIPEDKTYQWNNFIKDFTQSIESLKYKNKLKVASILWNQIKNSSSVKEYNPVQVYQHSELLMEYLKDEYKK